MEVEDEEEEEGGIISESVSASSVIQMFGGVGRFKKAGSSVTSPSSGEMKASVLALKLSAIRR